MENTVLDKIRNAILNDRHRFTFHSEQELASDRLIAVDAESVLLTGTIRRSEPAEPPPPAAPSTSYCEATAQIKTLAFVGPVTITPYKHTQNTP